LFVDYVGVGKSRLIIAFFRLFLFLVVVVITLDGLIAHQGVISIWVHREVSIVIKHFVPLPVVTIVLDGTEKPASPQGIVDHVIAGKSEGELRWIGGGARKRKVAKEVNKGKKVSQMLR
jgi:hypothetical protein